MTGAMVVDLSADGAEGEPDRAWTALVGIYRTEHATLVRLATLLTDDQAVAEELVQEAFVRLHPRVGRLDRPAAYLRTTVINLSRGHHRHRQVADRHLRAIRPPPSVEEPAPADDEVWAALGRLPERRRTALVLRFYLDLSDDDIAEVLGARPGTVRSLVSRGLASLRKELDPR